MPRAIDELEVISSVEMTCEAKVSDLSSSIFEEDSTEILLEIVKMLDGDQKYIGETFSIDTNEFPVDEDTSMFRAVVEVSELDGYSEPNIDCLKIEERN